MIVLEGISLQPIFRFMMDMCKMMLLSLKIINTSKCMLLVGSRDAVNACYWLVPGCSECMLLVGSRDAVNACYWLVLGMHVTGWF